MTVIANAKLNLYLDITGVREDGYHTLETVMQSITLSDIVEIDISHGSGISLSCDDPRIPSDERNIAYKAAQSYLGAAGISAKIDIQIQKRIPSGAGMGGGSADAAAVLHALDRHFGALSQEELFSIALSIGADVPFCLAGGTKLCRGIGEIMSELPSVGGCAFLVVMPDFTCPTGAAYKKYDERPLPAKNELERLVQHFPEGMHNTFEELYSDPRIERVKQTLMSDGALGAMLTGSGAAVFGVFADEDAAARASRSFPQYFTAACRPAEYGVKII